VTVGVDVVLTVVVVDLMGKGAGTSGHEHKGLVQPTTTVITIARAANSLTSASSHQLGTS
jgi:hypothetical protein